MVRSSNTLKINNLIISNDSPVYFIADIAANHDGDLSMAKSLIYLAAEAGANAAKFQHFQAESIVSDKGFQSALYFCSKEKEGHLSISYIYSASI